MNRSEHDDRELGQFVQLLTDHQAVIRGYIRVLIPNDSDIRDVLQNNPFFPALRSSHRLFQWPSPRKQIPWRQPKP